MKSRPVICAPLSTGRAGETSNGTREVGSFLYLTFHEARRGGTTARALHLKQEKLPEE